MVYRGPDPIVRHGGAGNRIHTLIVNTDALCAWVDEPTSWVAKKLGTQAGAQFSTIPGEPGAEDDVIKLQGYHQPKQIVQYLQLAYRFA